MKKIIRNTFYNIGAVLDKSRFSRHKDLTEKERVIAGALASGVALTSSGALVVALIAVNPSPERLAKSWAKANDVDHTQLCYTDNPETETGLHMNNDAQKQVSRVFAALEASGPIGRDMVDYFRANDTIFCFGPQHESGHAVHQPNGKALYFTSEEVGDMGLALSSYLFERRALYPYVQERVEPRQSEYITASALIWQRAVEATKAVIHVDAAFSMISEAHYGTPFTTEQWQDLVARSNRSAAAMAFEESYRENGDIRAARYAAFISAYHDSDLQAALDQDFLQWYMKQVDEQPEIRTSLEASICFDMDMNAYPCLQTKVYTVMVDPADTVHSESLDPATLVALSDIMMDGRPFLTKEQAQDLIDDPDAIATHNYRSFQMYGKAVQNAAQYATDNYDGEKTVLGRGITADMNDLDYQ